MISLPSCQFGRIPHFYQKNKIFSRIIKYILCITLIFLSSCDSNLNTRNFNFNYIVKLEPSNDKKLELWLPVPQSNEVQKISNLNIDSQGLNYELKDEKEHGNKYLYVFSKNGINDTKTITMSFDVLRQEHQNVKYAEVNPEKYLSPSMMVPVGNLFDSIIEENELNKKNLKTVYDFVLSRMHYGKPKSVENQYYKEPWLSSKGKYGLKQVSRDAVVSLYQKAKSTNGSFTFGNGNSLYACDIGVGNCTDYHSYFLSLSRTLHVPARFHMGFSIPNEEEGVVGGYHCWADYYIDGKGWHPVDISEADKDPEKAEYFSNTVCENRVKMMVGRDFILENSDQGPLNLFIYPLLEIDDKKSTAFTKYFTYKNI